MKPRNFPARKQARREAAIERTLASMRRTPNPEAAALTVKQTEAKLVADPLAVRTKKDRSARGRRHA